MELIAVAMAGMILGYLLGCLVADLKKAARIASAAQLDDYIDWAKVPEGYDWVAVDNDGWKIAYPSIPRLSVSIEVKSWLDGGDWIQLPDYAIIGPLPPWRESLRRRPGSEAKSKGASA